MHRISDVRIGGTSLLNFRIFHELCGNESLHNALIVTTMWSGVDPELGESRERELATAEDFFKPVLDHGAQLVRHYGTLESAQAILRLFITNKSTTLRIQRELVDEGKELINTAAGAELARVFAEQTGRLEAGSRKLQKQMEEASRAQDQEGWTILQLELDKVQEKKRLVEDENERLRRMMPSVIDTATELVERLEERPYLLSNLQAGFRTGGQAMMEFQELLTRNELERAKKRTRKENERLQNDTYAVSRVLEHLKSRSIELYDDLQEAASRDGQDMTEPLAKRVDQILEEMEEMQRQFDVAIESQNKLIVDVRKHQEESASGRTICERMSGWFCKLAVELLS